MINGRSPYEQFTQISYSGKELLRNHSLNEEGIWQVKGEDFNCDLGGLHSQPDLGIYYGELEDVIRMAVNIPLFWQWGAGGSIKKLAITPIESRRSELLKSKSRLQDNMDELEAEMKLIDMELKGL